MTPPRATYRIQFRPAFGFADAVRLVPYLHGLGISHVYASPVFQARTGSDHGYDVTDPNRLNHQLGTEAEFRTLASTLHAHGMGLILDIVPNHQAASTENPAWRHVLEHGPRSPFAAWFDIDWDADPDRRVRLPVLGRPLDAALRDGELALGLDPDSGPYFRYGSARYPLSPPSWATLLDALEGGPFSSLVAAIATNLRRAPSPEAATRLEADLMQAYRGDEAVRHSLDAALARFAVGAPGAVRRLEQLLDVQHYRLLYWRTGLEVINYRRFFDIADLVGVRQEDPAVFGETHELLRQLIHEGIVDGVRVDHVDGLRDPADYLGRLRGLWPPGAEPFIVVEKILGASESLPEWPVAGTTGYDFLHDVTGLLVDPEGLAQHALRYQAFTGDTVAPADRAYEQKREALRTLFPAEVGALAQRLARIASRDPRFRGLQEADLRAAIVELTACMPVYRTYATSLPLAGRDRATFFAALDEARRRAPAVPPAAYALLEQLAAGATGVEPSLEWLLRWQQLSGPAMAKGYEDTTLYRYVPLVAVNVVGSEPESLEHPPDVAAFHRRMVERHERWPATFNATATHDTKRGEDTRARIAVLSEIPDRWWDLIDRWASLAAPFVAQVDGLPAPSARDVVLFFQTVVGAWPGDMDLPDDDYRARIRAYMVKAAREAGARTSWLDPNPGYESALQAFCDGVLDPARSSGLIDEVRSFVAHTAPAAVSNSLAQLALKLFCPGTPDFYQGTELWDLSLVDPDNRRPVDFQERIEALDEIQGVPLEDHPTLAARLLASHGDGRIKLLVTERGLAARQRWPELFSRGAYLPGQSAGRHSTRVLVALRRNGRQWGAVVVPRLSWPVAGAGGFPLGPGAWDDTSVLLPADAPDTWQNVLTGERVQGPSRPGARILIVGDVLRSLPVAILVGDAEPRSETAAR